jgi:DNA-binding transcriptional MerR regulator
MNNLEIVHNTIQTAIRKHFIDRSFSIKDCGSSYREVLYWDSKGLLPFTTTDHKWKKFNLAELIWIRLIARLRKFDVGVPLIKQVKEICFTPIASEAILEREEVLLTVIKGILGAEYEQMLEREKEKIRDYIKESLRLPYFESWLISLLAKEDRMYLLIKQTKEEDNIDVHPIVICKDERQTPIDLAEELLSGDHICICLNDLFEDVLKFTDLKKISNIFNLNEKERKILDALRSGKYKRVEIKLDGDQPKMIYGKEIIPVKNKISLSDMIQKRGYHSIEVVTEDGKVIAIQRETRFKL